MANEQPDEKLSFVLKSLQNPDMYTRLNALRELEAHPQAAAVEALIHVLRHDDYDAVRGMAAVALGKLKDPRAVRPLLETLQYDSPYVTNYAVTALGEIGDPQSIPPLREALLHGNLYTHAAITKALLKIQQQESKEEK